MISALRGATSVENDTRDEILKAVKELFTAIMSENNLNEEDLGFVQFSQTKDLRSRNAAEAVRKAGFCSSVPLFCTQEADIEGGMPKVIRVAIILKDQLKSPAKMIYLNRAANLRPDLNT